MTEQIDSYLAWLDEQIAIWEAEYNKAYNKDRESEIVALATSRAYIMAQLMLKAMLPDKAAPGQDAS